MGKPHTTLRQECDLSPVSARCSGTSHTNNPHWNWISETSICFIRSALGYNSASLNHDTLVCALPQPGFSVNTNPRCSPSMHIHLYFLPIIPSPDGSPCELPISICPLSLPLLYIVLPSLTSTHFASTDAA